MHYREFEVPEPLRRHLQCVWRLRDPNPCGDPQTVYPDGRCELIVHFGTPMSMFELDRGWSRQQPLLFAGQLTSAIRLAADAPVDCFGVRLKPAASACVLDRPPSRLRDRVVDLSRIDRVFAGRLASAVGAFAAEPDDSRLWEVLGARLGRHPIDQRIESAVAQLEIDQGRSQIEALASVAAMSLRSLQSRFVASVGIGPKQFARIVRLQATIRALDDATASLADLAADAGYSDQAHATRELSRFTGLTPARLRAALAEDRQDEGTIRMAAAFVRGRGEPSN